MQIRKKIAVIVASVSTLALSASVHAATVLDTATKAAVTTGFTDLKDTVLDILGISYPFIIGASVLLASPSIVKGMLRIASSK